MMMTASCAVFIDNRLIMCSVQHDEMLKLRKISGTVLCHQDQCCNVSKLQIPTDNCIHHTLSSVMHDYKSHYVKCIFKEGYIIKILRTYCIACQCQQASFFSFPICHSTVALHTNISLGGINNRSVSGCCSETVSVNIDKTFLHFKDSQANIFVLNAHP